MASTTESRKRSAEVALDQPSSYVQLREPINLRKLQLAMWYAPTIPTFEVDNLVKRGMMEGETLQVFYKESRLGTLLGGGFRLYPNREYPSTNSLPSAYRAAAQYERVDCLDLVNCHPSIVAQIPAIKQDPSLLRAVEGYLNNREQHIQDVMYNYGVSRDAAKELFIRLLNSGSVARWKEDHNVQGPQPVLPITEAFQRVNHACHQWAVQSFPEWCEVIDEEEQRLRPGDTLLSYYCQREERKCIEALRAVFEERVVGILHDEIQITGGVSEEDLLAANAAVASVVPGMRVAHKNPKLPDWINESTKLPFENHEHFDCRLHRDLCTWQQECYLDSEGKDDPITSDKLIHLYSNKRQMIEPVAGFLKLLEPDTKEGAFAESKADKKKREQVLSYVRERLAEEMPEGAPPKPPPSLQTRFTIWRKPSQEFPDLETYQCEVDRFMSRMTMFAHLFMMMHMNRFFARIGTEVYKLSYDRNGCLDTLVPMKHPEFKNLLSDMANSASTFLTSPLAARFNGLGMYPNPIKCPTLHLNTFGGLPTLSKPAANPEVQRKVEVILKHLSEVLCSGHEQSYEYLLNWLATLFQKKEKLRTFLFIYSKEQQAGKGIIFDDRGLIARLLGRYYLKPDASINSENGLLGRFNWLYANRLLVYLDENTEFSFDIRKNKELLRYLSSSKRQFKAEGKVPVDMPDHASLVMTTNDIKGARVLDGEARTAVLECSNKYCKRFADAEVDGMTQQTRREYFNNLAAAIDEQSVQEAFLHMLLSRDISDFDLQVLPKTELRQDMQSIVEDPVEEFARLWREEFQQHIMNAVKPRCFDDTTWIFRSDSAFISFPEHVQSNEAKVNHVLKTIIMDGQVQGGWLSKDSVFDYFHRWAITSRTNLRNIEKAEFHKRLRDASKCKILKCPVQSLRKTAARTEHFRPENVVDEVLRKLEDLEAADGTECLPTCPP